MNLKVYEGKELWLEYLNVIPESLRIELTEIKNYPNITQLLYFSSMDDDGKIKSVKNGIPFTSDMSFHFVAN